MAGVKEKVMTPTLAKSLDKFYFDGFRRVFVKRVDLFIKKKRAVTHFFLGYRLNLSFNFYQNLVSFIYSCYSLINQIAMIYLYFSLKNPLIILYDILLLRSDDFGWFLIKGSRVLKMKDVI